MNRFYPGEQWKEITLEDKLQLRYAISSFGRIMSFTSIYEEGRIMRPQQVDSYTVFRYKTKRNGKVFNKTLFIRKLVAEYFLPPPEPDQKYVLLIDRNRQNNRVENLKWATKQEMIDHYKNSPFFIQARLNKKPRGIGHKLTTTKVILIKKKLFDPNRKTRLKMIAKQFGISEMQLNRIKRGENWGHVKI